MSEQYKRFCQFEKTCVGADSCEGPVFNLLARTIVKNKCWVVESDGTKVATILANDGNKGVTLVHDGQREQFSSLKLLSDRYNIIIDKNKVTKVAKETHEVYGYPCENKPQNALWDVQHKLPVFTKGSKSKSFFCAGYYIVQFNNGWVKSYCPKLITLNRYPYQGPFKTQEERNIQLKIANGGHDGEST
jgi:hypothetical protein